MGALKLEFAERPERQLDDILSYIAIDNPDAASKVADEIVEVLEKVRDSRRWGRKSFPSCPIRKRKPIHAAFAAGG